MNDGDTQLRRPRPSVPRVIGAVWQVVKQTVVACLRYRATGLAAEAAFFTILSLPPLVFGLAGAVGFVANQFRPVQIDRIRDQVIHLSLNVLTPDVVHDVIEPTVDKVLSGGRFDVISIGFLLALWSGSRAFNVFIDAIAVIHGLGGRRNFAVARALAFLLYLLFLLVGMILIPLVLAGPDLVDRLIPDPIGWLQELYWPVVLLGSTILLATLYRLAVPARMRLCSELPGAVLALMIWAGGSVVLRIALSRSTSSTTIYGPLTAPIALLIWLFLVSIAILIGAAFNASLNKHWPWSRPAPAQRRPRVRRSPLQVRVRGTGLSGPPDQDPGQESGDESATR